MKKTVNKVVVVLVLALIGGENSALASQRTCLRVSDQSDNVKEFYLHGYDGDFVYEKVSEILNKIKTENEEFRDSQGMPLFLWHDIEQYVYGTFGRIEKGKLFRVSHAEIGCDEIDKVDAYIDLKITEMGNCASIEKRFTGFRPLK